MKRDISPDEMKQRIARLSDMEPSKRSYEGSGIPVSAYEMLAARNIFMMMAPAGRSRSMNKPAILGHAGLEVAIVDCPPGNGAELHAHERTIENFMPLDGRYQIIWGEQGEHSVILNPFELMSVPNGVYRAFRNVEDRDAKMLVLIQGMEGDSMNDITYEASVGDRIQEKFGSQTVANMAHIGIRFSEKAS